MEPSETLADDFSNDCTIFYDLKLYRWDLQILQTCVLEWTRFTLKNNIDVMLFYNNTNKIMYVTITVNVFSVEQSLLFFRFSTKNNALPIGATFW